MSIGILFCSEELRSVCCIYFSTVVIYFIVTCFLIHDKIFSGFFSTAILLSNHWLPIAVYRISFFR